MMKGREVVGSKVVREVDEITLESREVRNGSGEMPDQPGGMV